MKPIFVVLLFAASTIQPGAQTPYARADIEYGQRLYSTHCTTCHGTTGNSVAGVDFAVGFRNAASDRDLTRILGAGIPGTAMPAGNYNAAELAGLVAYLRNFRAVPADGGAATVGDAVRGRALFEGKGGCLACHRIRGHGSRTAPDLSDAGAVRTAGALARSLVEPAAAMLPMNRSVRALTREGKVVVGRRLNEDTHTVQIIDEHERLVSLTKADLREYQPLAADALLRRHAHGRGTGGRARLPPVVERPDAMRARAVAVTCASLLMWAGLDAQVTYQRLLSAANEAHNWLTHSGTYSSQRYSLLAQVTPRNVDDLELKWVYQAPVIGAWEATPLVVDGVMYVSQRLNDIVALDAKTGRVFWVYQYTPSADRRVCCGSNNRGLAMLGDTLFIGTLDARLIAVDARNGRPLWSTEVGDPKAAYSVTLAPLVVKDKVIIGVGGGDFGISGFIAAYDARTGKQAWRFSTIPGPGQPGHESWEPCPPTPRTVCDPEAWKHGGGAVWVTGSYDPELNLTYWGTGNPGPDWNPDQRPGDNLYTDSVVGARCRFRRAQMAFSVHAPRSVRLRLGQRARARGHELERDARQGDAVGQPQRVLLCVGSRHRPVSSRPAVRQGQLGLGPHGHRAAHPDTPAAWCADVARRRRRHELVLAVLQPAYRTVLRDRLGRLRLDFQTGAGGIRGGPGLRWWRAHHVHDRAWRAGAAVSQARPGQQLDRSRRPRGCPGPRSPHRNDEVEIRDARFQRRRHSDDGVRSPVHRWTGRLFLRDGRAQRRPPVDVGAGRPDGCGADDLRSRRQPVCRDHRRTLAVHIRSSPLAASPFGLVSFAGWH
jgi:putative heme-binding domain-containing protein